MTTPCYLGPSASRKVIYIICFILGSAQVFSPAQMTQRLDMYAKELAEFTKQK